MLTIPLLRLSLDDNSRLDPERFAHVCNVGMMACSHQQEFILSIFITAAASFSPCTKDFNQIGDPGLSQVPGRC